MTPHADVPISSGYGTNGHRPDWTVHSTQANGVTPASCSPGSHLQASSHDEVLDLLCIGFGPASLAVAVALHDSLDSSQSPRSEIFKYGAPKVAFLERQPQFAWHSGMLLPGAKMQITFIKDLATLRNPRSEFTFLNYLHQNNRLVDFTNLSTFLPQRLEYEDYMRWCAKHFDDIVEYNQEVVEIAPVQNAAGNGLVKIFTVKFRDVRTHQISTRKTKHVVIAAGGSPRMPKHFPRNHPRVIHSSKFSQAASQLFRDPLKPHRVAVIGAGQSAAEIFEHIQNHYPNSRSTLIIRGTALRPSDDSPFVNEIFNPSRVDEIFQKSPQLRAAEIEEDRNTNYSVVRLELLERLYETLYTQRIRYDSEEEWPHRVLANRSVSRVESSPEIPEGVRIVMRENRDDEAPFKSNAEEFLDVDAVFVATGYNRNSHEQLLDPCRHLAAASKANDGSQWAVGRDYKAQFKPGAVSADAGVWLQGCCENTHGLSDSLLSVLATRSGELVQSIFGDDQPKRSITNGNQPAKQNGYH